MSDYIIFCFRPVFRKTGRKQKIMAVYKSFGSIFDAQPYAQASRRVVKLIGFFKKNLMYKHLSLQLGRSLFIFGTLLIQFTSHQPHNMA